MEESDDEIQEESTEQRYIVFPQRERKTERQKKKQKEAKFLVSTFILKSWKTLIHYLSHPIKKVTNIETAVIRGFSGANNWAVLPRVQRIMQRELYL